MRAAPKTHTAKVHGGSVRQRSQDKVQFHIIQPLDFIEITIPILIILDRTKNNS